MKKKTRCTLSLLIALMLVFSSCFVFSTGTVNALAVNNKCPGCGAAVPTKLTKKTYPTSKLTRTVSKKKLKRQNMYMLINKCHNGDSVARTMFATKNKSTTVTWTVSGDATVKLGYADLKLGASYTQTSTKSTGGGTSRKVPAKTYVAFYAGHPVDIYSVSICETRNTLCPWCGKVKQTSTKKYCVKATVPIKTNTLYWATRTNAKDSFPKSYAVDV